MKAIFAILLVLLAVAASGCAVRGHSGPNSTGGRVSTPAGSVGGSVRY